MMEVWCDELKRLDKILVPLEPYDALFPSYGLFSSAFWLTETIPLLA